MNAFLPTLLGQTGSSAADQLTETARESTSAVMDSFAHLTAQFIQFAPKIIIAVLVLIVGYIVARLVSKAVTAIAERLGLQRAAESGGMVTSMQQVGIERTMPQIVGVIIFWLLICVFAVASFDILDMPALTGAMEKVIAYIPKLLVATFVVVLGLLLAAFLKGVVATSADRVGITYAPQLANAVYWILALMTFIAAFDQLQIEFKLLNEAILIGFAAVALGFGLSFGLGGRDVMAGILSGYYVRQRLHTGDRVQVANLEGIVREVGPVATIIETQEEGMTYRHSIPNAKMLNEAVR
jgi:small-conductance mechanosensitive channel